MLKRLSASLAPASSSNSPSISPSHSHSSSLDRAGHVSSSNASAYNQHYHSSSSSHHSGASLGAPSLHDINTAHVAATPGAAYPRPSGLSTPYSSSAPDLSPGIGYFGAHPASNSTGALSPSLHTTSRNVSPAQSPMLESRPFPWSSNTHASADPLYGTYIPPAPVDRPTLQKSLRALETLLVTLDEYRELSTRLSKVEKRLAKAGKELAVNMGDEKSSNGSSNKGREAYSMLQALSMTSNLFDSLSDVSTKFSRHLSKEYDLINDLIGKSFKKIAKEERLHDESMESLDNKLKKANYAYDKKIRSSAPGSNNAQNVHEQFVPLLSQLTEDITRNKNNHSMNMALRREGIVKEAARTLTCLAEIEFRKNCELVKKLGGYIGNVLAIQALLGPSPATSGSNGNTGTAGKGEKNGLGEMPNYWPNELPDPDELGRLQSHQQSQQGGHVHPLASVQSSPLLDQGGGQEQQYHAIETAGIGGRSLDDLLPPKAPFTSSDTISERSRKGSDAYSATSGTSASSQTRQQAPPPSTTRSYSSISNGSSNSSQQAVPTRSVSLQEINDAPIDRYDNIAVNERGNELNSGKNGMRSVSHPLQEEARQATRATSAAMDHDATVTMRNVHTKPSVDTSFFPSAHTSSTVQDEKPTRALSQEQKVDSPTYREHNVARMPALQPALSYSPSQSGKVGYFGDRKHDRRITEEEEETETSNLRRRDGEESHFKMPVGFIMEESSPEQYTQQHHHHRRHPITTSPELLAHVTASGMHSSSASGGSHGDSPTLSMGTAANTSTTSYSRNLNESYTNSPAHESVLDKGNHHQAESREKVRRDHDGELVDKPKEGGGGAQLERSLSIESTASEKSFVARMKALYAEERESRRISSSHKASQATSPSSHNNAGDTSAHSNPSETKPSQRRVSTIAKKWEEKSLNGKMMAASSSVAGLGTGRPMHNHAHRASMPVIPTMTHTSSPHQTGSHKPNMHRYSSAGAAASGMANQAHPSVCGCEDCTREGYANRETKGGAMQSRRVSMPPGGS